MNAKMKIAIFGIGGVGGFVGGALARSHPDTYFLVRGENLRAIRRDGLHVRSVLLGDFTARPKLASDDGADLGVMDAVIVACKGHDLPSVCKALTPMVGLETLVVPLLNGVLVSEVMAPLLPPCLLADGVIYIFSHLEAPGQIVQTAGPCTITLGMKDGSRPAVLEELAGILNAAGVKTTLSENILVDSWRKYMTMGSNSVLCCYYDGPLGKVREDPGWRETLRGIAGDMAAVASARGVTLPDGLPDQLVGFFEEMPPDTMTSLYRDLSGGKPAGQTELDLIVGRMVEMGRAAGIPTPYHDTVYEKFKGQKGGV